MSTATNTASATAKHNPGHLGSANPDTLNRLADTLETQSTRMPSSAYLSSQEAAKMLRTVASNVTRAPGEPAALIRYTQSPAVVIVSLRDLASTVARPSSATMAAAADMLEKLVTHGALSAYTPVLKRRASDC